jgi:hypothetical protein
MELYHAGSLLLVVQLNLQHELVAAHAAHVRSDVDYCAPELEHWLIQVVHQLSLHLYLHTRQITSFYRNCFVYWS